MSICTNSSNDSVGLNNIKLVILHEFALLLNSSYNIEQILNESAKKIREATNSNGCHIMFSKIVMDRLSLETVIHDTDTPLPAGIDLSRGKVAQETYLTGEIIIIDDTIHDPRIIQQAREAIGHRSMVAVPVIVKGEIIGAMTVYSKKVANYNHGSGDFLLMLGNHLGLAIENSRLMLELQKAAIVDSLTDAFNHRYLRSWLTTFIEENREHPISLIMIDVDGFKLINDSHGHLAGDFVLQEVAKILKSTVRQGDIVTRYGGDEFALVLPGAEAEETKIIGSRIEQTIAGNEFNFGQETFMVTVSWGAVTLAAKDLECVNDIIKPADRKLYEMKKKRKKPRTSTTVE